MSRFNVAMEAWLRSISSVTMAGSVSIGAGALPGGGPPGPSSGRAGMKSPRSRMVCSASPSSGSDLPATSRRPARLAGEPSAWVTSTNSLPPASAIGRGGRQLPKGEPQGLHGVGHHLLMTDGDVDVVALIAGRGDGEQRGDRPALDNLEPIVDQAPFDVLGVAEVRFDPPAQLSEPHDLRIGQCWLLLTLLARSPVPAFRLPAGRRWRAVWRRLPWRQLHRLAPV